MGVNLLSINESGEIVCPRNDEDCQWIMDAPQSDYDEIGLPPKNPNYNARTKMKTGYGAMGMLVEEMGLKAGDDPETVPLDMPAQEFADKLWEYIADYNGPKQHVASAAHMLAFATLAIERGATRVYAV